MKAVQNRLLPLIFLTFLFGATAVHFFNNASSGVLGKDESLYIFLAKGHYSHTPIDAPAGSWLDAIIKGTRRTADPPGFFFLLHFWQYISFSEAWLRLLPYLFFIAGIVAIIRIGILLELPLTISIFMGYLPLASYFMVSHAVEIRAYGMEIFLTYLMIYSALNIIRTMNNETGPSKGKWIALSLIMAAGLSSRFSFVISSCAMYATLWICLFRKLRTPPFKNYFFPLTVSSFSSFLFFILFFGMRSYLPAMDPMNSVSADFEMYAISGTFLDKIAYFTRQIYYIPAVMLSGPQKSPSFFNPIIGTLLSGAGLLFAFQIASGLRQKKIVTQLKKDSLLFTGMFLFPLISICLSMLLALIGLHPFAVATRWSLYLHPAYHLFILGLLRMSMYNESVNPKKTHPSSAIPRYAGLYLVTGLLALMYGVSYASHIVTFRMGGPQRTDRVIGKVISENEIKKVDAWFISVGEANAFKYHVLYGKLKNKLSPNSAIIIEKRPAAIKQVACSELGDIYKNAEKGSKVVMVLGHVDKDQARVYIKKLRQYFTNAKCGILEPSNEQACYAVR
jgi:hypothetical protein